MKKVECSFCGKEMDCPNEMLKCNKHVCFECTDRLDEIPEGDRENVHIDIPKEKLEGFELLINNISKDAYSDFWEVESARLRKKTKRKISEYSFMEGVRFAFELMSQMENFNQMIKEKKGKDQEFEELDDEEIAG